MKRLIKTNWNPVFDNKPTFDNPRIRFSQKFINKYLAKAKYILDIGCGIGSYTYLIDRHDCVGVDLQLNALKTARRYCPNSNFIVASVMHLPFRDEIFGLVSALEVIEEFEVGTEARAIREVHRILIRRGWVVLSNYNNRFICRIVHPAVALGRIRLYHSQKLIELITKIGFSINEHITKGGRFTLISIPTFYFYKHLLHKKEGKVMRFLYEKSDKEFNSKREGIAFTFIAAQKIDH